MKLIKKLIRLALIVGAIYGLWTVWYKVQNAEPINIDPQEQREAKFNLAVAARVQDLEKTGGGGRVREDAGVENAARHVYNQRHPSSRLPFISQK